MAKVKYIRGSKVPKAKSAMSNLDAQAMSAQGPFLSTINPIGAQPVPKADGLSQQIDQMELNKEKQSLNASLGPTTVIQNGKTEVVKPKAKVTKKKAKDMQSMIDEMDSIGYEAFKAKYGKK